MLCIKPVASAIVMYVMGTSCVIDVPFFDLLSFAGIAARYVQCHCIAAFK